MEKNVYVSRALLSKQDLDASIQNAGSNLILYMPTPQVPRLHPLCPICGDTVPGNSGYSFAWPEPAFQKLEKCSQNLCMGVCAILFFFVRILIWVLIYVWELSFRENSYIRQSYEHPSPPSPPGKKKKKNPPGHTQNKMDRLLPNSVLEGAWLLLISTRKRRVNIQKRPGNSSQNSLHYIKCYDNSIHGLKSARLRSRIIFSSFCRSLYFPIWHREP